MMHRATAVEVAIEDRQGPQGFAPGAWCSGADMLLFLSDRVAHVRVWGSDVGAWWRRAEGTAWNQFEPEIDVARWTLVVPPVILGVRWTLCGVRDSESPEQLRLPFPDDSFPNETSRAVAQAITALPRWAKEVIRNLPSALQWPFLVLLARAGQPAADLIESTPALALLLARADVRSRPPKSSEVADLVKWKQRKLAELFGIPPSESSVRVLRKIPLSELSLGLLDRVTTILRSPQGQLRLRHLRRITPTVCSVLEEPSAVEVVAVPLLAQLSLKPAQGAAATVRRAVNTVAWARRLRYVTCDQLQSIDHAARAHSSLSTLLASVQYLPADHPLPKPPFRGRDGIEPIRSVGQLVREGSEMHHCVSGLLKEVMCGVSTIYSVVSRGERATLELRRCGCRWWLREISGWCNHPPDERLLVIVEEWFEAVGGIPQERVMVCPTCRSLPDDRRKVAWSERPTPYRVNGVDEAPF